MPTYFTQYISLLLCSSAEHAVYALGGLDYQKLLAGHAPLKNTFSIAMEMEEVNKTQTILCTDEQKLSPIPPALSRSIEIIFRYIFAYLRWK